MLTLAWRTQDATAVARRTRPSRDMTALALICLAVLVANLPTLLGVFHPDPLDSRGEITRMITPGLLGGRPTIDPSNGYNSQALGHLAALDLLHLQLPWWNPFEGTGMPLLGETESAALFPPTLLTALPNGQLLEHVLLEMAAGIGTYLVLRRVGLTRSAALAGGIVFALCGKFAWFADATVNPLALLPLVLLGIEHAFSSARDRRRPGWRLIALAGALTAYAGFPEVAYPDLLLAVVWAGWRCGCLDRRDRSRFILKLVLGAGVAILLAAPMLVAMFEDLSRADLASHTGSRLGARHLPLSELPQLLMPYVYGPLDGAPRSPIWIMAGGYLSIAPVMLAVFSLTTSRWRGLKLVLLAWDVLVFAHMYGAPPWLGHVLGALPAMSRIQFYRYATAAFELPVIVLAALGIDDLICGPARPRRLLAVAALGVGAVIVTGVAARPILDALPLPPSARSAFLAASLAWGIATTIAIGLSGILRGDRLRRRLLVFVIALDAVVLFAVPEFSAPRSTQVDLTPVTYLKAHLGESRFFTLGPIQPNYGSYFQIGSLRVDDFPPRSYAHFIHMNVDPYDHFVSFLARDAPSVRHEIERHVGGLRAAAVRYVVIHPGETLPAPPHTFRLVLRSASGWIYQVSRAASFFSAPGCTVSSTGLDNVQLSCRRSSTLIRRETWFPGWSSRIDGQSTSIHRIDGVFQAVHVPAGVHTITFAYLPIGMDWALIALLAGSGLLVAASVRQLRSGQKATVDAAPTLTVV